MTKSEILEKIRLKRSFLCIGLDTDLKKIPPHLLADDDPVFAFNKQIIDATHDITLAYKPNIAFYESLGAKGWVSLEKTIAYLRQFDVFTIADAKRGDIGNTSSLYARAFFENLDFDAVTVAPYMGSDSVMPFLDYKNKWVILLALTSNKGANDFQLIKNVENGKQVYIQVLETSAAWGTDENLMYVVGATKAEMLAEIRRAVPHHFLLVPGVGAQGGSLQEVVQYGMNKQCGLIVNSSRGIIYASNGTDFASVARAKAMELQQEMDRYLVEFNIV